MYTKTERLIFGPYQTGNGDEAIYGDPLKILRHLTLALSGNPNAVLNEAKQKEEPLVSARARGQLADAAVSAFGLTPFNQGTGQGTTEEDALKVLTHFLRFVSSKKKTVDISPTSWPSTEPSLDNETSPSESSSDSGLTSLAFADNTPGPSPVGTFQRFQLPASTEAGSTP